MSEARSARDPTLTSLKIVLDDKRFELYSKGYCDADIAKEMGVSFKSISYWRKKRQLPVVFSSSIRITYALTTKN